MLGVRCGDEIIFQAEGTDAVTLSRQLKRWRKIILVKLTSRFFRDSANGNAGGQRPCRWAISGLSVQNGIAIGPVKWFTANDQKLRSAPSILRKKSCRDRVCYRHCCL